jgi:hypothetical protein
MMKAESYLPASTRIFRWWPSGTQYRSNILVFRRLFLLPNFVAAQQTYNHNSKLELRKEKKEREKNWTKLKLCVKISNNSKLWQLLCTKLRFTNNYTKAITVPDNTLHQIFSWIWRTQEDIETSSDYGVAPFVQTYRTFFIWIGEAADSWDALTCARSQENQFWGFLLTSAICRHLL